MTIGLREYSILLRRRINAAIRQGDRNAERALRQRLESHREFCAIRHGVDL